MSSVLFSAAAASATTGWSASQVPVDAHHAEDLYAVWKQIFAQERAVESPASAVAMQRASALAPALAPALDESGAGTSQGPAPGRSGDPSIGLTPMQQGLAGAERSDAVAAGASAVAGADGAGTPGTGAITVVNGATTVVNTTTTVVNTTPRSALPADSFQLAGPPPEPIGGAALLAPSAQPSSAEPLAESVRVFVQGPEVAIVVRDATISDQDAVSCAFETARELTGLRSSLQQLTLNGRTLYQRQIDSGTREAPPGGAFVFFAC